MPSSRALSTRALSLSEDAAEEKRAMQRRLEDEIERVKGELVKARDELTEQRTRSVHWKQSHRTEEH